MRQLNRQRHQLRRLVTGKTEHQSLVACATGIDTHSDIGRLPVERGQHGAGIAIKAKLCPRVTDLADCVASHSRLVDRGVSCDLAGDDHQASRDESLTSDAGSWVGGQCGIKYSIRDLIGDFIWMSFGNGLRGKQITGFASQNSSFVYTQTQNE
jgi:hypothetical protein